MKKWDNVQASLKNLSAIYDEEPPYDVVTLTGMVALFQICFEQSWKAMKEILEEQGYTEFALGSPKRVIKTAFEARMITEEDVWLEALQAHNNVAHRSPCRSWSRQKKVFTRCSARCATRWRRIG